MLLSHTCGLTDPGTRADCSRLPLGTGCDISERVAKEVFRYGMLRMGFEGGFRRGFGTRGVLRRKVRRVSALGHSEGFRRGFKNGGPFGVALVVGLEISGWGYTAAFFFAGTVEGFKMAGRNWSVGSQIDG